MSAIVQCTACDFGQHEHHDHDWGIKPGLLGGAVCDCPGDCAERFQARIDKMRAVFRSDAYAAAVARGG